MRRAAGLALAALVLVPAHAGAGTTRPSLGLTATPARVALVGTGRTSIRVVNPGVAAVVVDVARAGFALDLRGRPHAVSHGGARAATAWLSVRPKRFLLAPGASRLLTVTSRLPRAVEPGDHDALVLLATRPWRGAAVAVRMRIGVVVVVRAPGRVVRALHVRRLRVRRTRRTRILELPVVNQGNTTELIDDGVVRLSLRRGRARAWAPVEPRELRPRTVGLVQFRYRGKLEGWVTARLRVAEAPGRPAILRTFRVKV